MSRTITQIVVAKDILCFANVPILRLKSDVFHNERGSLTVHKNPRIKQGDNLLLCVEMVVFDLTLSAQEAVAAQPEVFLPGIANTKRAP